MEDISGEQVKSGPVPLTPEFLQLNVALKHAMAMDAVNSRSECTAHREDPMNIWPKILQLFRSLSANEIAAPQSAATGVDEIDIYRQLFKNMSQVVWVDNLDKSKSILTLGSYEDFYDRPSANLKDDPLDWLNAIHEEDRSSVETKVPDQLTGNFDARYRVVHRDETIKWLRDRSFLLRDQDLQPAYLAGVVEDITAEVLMEEKLRQNNKMVAIGALSGGIAHDFNNILAVVQGNIELAMLDDIPDETKDLLQRAFEASQKGATLTHRLLAYSRLQPLSPTILDPSTVIKGLQVMLERTLTESVELEIISGGGMWKCDVDQNELETALLNLVINADQAMGSKGKLTIEVYNARLDADYARQHEDVSPGQYVCFAITDTGCGMEKAELERAFEPFYTTKPVGQGSGLGLSMAYGFTKQSGGHLKLYSEVGCGTTVKLYLPRAKGQVESSGSAAPVPDRNQLVGMSCLIIEDNPDVRKAVVLQAQSLGLTTHTAHDAESASASILAHPEIKIVLCDVVLSGDSTGPEIVAELRTRYPDLQVAYMSGYTENSIIHDGRLDDGIILLQKPFTIDQLLNTFLDLTT
jgi:signal transduction histidine kinase